MMAAACGRAMASSSRATSTQSARHGGVASGRRGGGARLCAGQRVVWPVAMAVLWTALSGAPQTRADLVTAIAPGKASEQGPSRRLLHPVQKGGLLASGRHNAFLEKRNATYGLERSKRSAPIVPGEPVSVLDPDGGDHALSWSGRTRDGNCLVLARRGGGGGRAGQDA